MSYTQELGKRAKAAEAFISSASTMQKNKALAAISKALIENSSLIIAENAKDIAAAKENGMSEAKQDRLMLDASRIEGIAKGVDQIIALGDPIGEIIGGSQREERIDILKARMTEMGLDEADYGHYLDLRRFGGTKHAGYGLGFERAVMYLTGMGNIRDVLPYPRTVNNLY